MRLADLLQGIYTHDVESRFKDHSIALISCDSRESQANGLFVALPGLTVNGADFIAQAIAQGANTVAKTGAGRQLGKYLISEHVCVLDVPDPKQFLRQAAERFYGQPSQKLGVIGITGTNGKTTITYLLESIIHAAGQKCGVIGTVNYRIGSRILPSKNTTPSFLDNERYLAQLVTEQAEFCVMEVSSHALAQGRVEGIHFSAAVFTNLTQDHLDFHKDMESYFQAKALLFTGLHSNACAIINSDDAYGRRLTALSRGKVTTYGFAVPADIQAVDVRYDLKGTALTVRFPDGKINMNTGLIGRHNVYNILAAAACAYRQGFALAAIQKGIEQLRQVPGRLDPVEGPQDFFVFIDYAHTEDGLVNVLKALRAVSSNKIIVVFGCGGDRDHGKRPKMGQAACALADYAIVTSDNPRTEDPQAIINAVIGGFSKKNFEICIERREAIERALKMARKGDVVLIAGKGHEDYQIFKDQTIPFNEREITCSLLKKLSKPSTAN